MIIGVDEGGLIDTIKFNQNVIIYSSEEKSEYEKLLIEMISATKRNDLKAIGFISTKSAVIHQEVNPKKNLNFFIDICNKIKALGVIVACIQS